MRAAILIGLFAVSDGFGTSCAGGMPHCSAITPDSVFFVGEVIGVKRTGDRWQNIAMGTDPVSEVTFRVTEAFFGTRAGAAVAVRTTRYYKPGMKDIFVDAYRYQGRVELHDLCRVAVPGPETLLDFLRRGKAGRGVPASLTVFAGDPVSFESVAVSVDGPVQRRIVYKAGDGGIRFERLPPGRYRLRARFRGMPHALISETEREVKILPQACASVIVEADPLIR